MKAVWHCSSAMTTLPATQASSHLLRVIGAQLLTDGSQGHTVVVFCLVQPAMVGSGQNQDEFVHQGTGPLACLTRITSLVLLLTATH
jgi:hypothetical protein